MEIQTGHISMYLPEKSWGHIAQQVGGITVKHFFHKNEYRCKNPPQIGIEVEFSVSPVREGKYPTALNVTPKQ